MKLYDILLEIEDDLQLQIKQIKLDIKKKKDLMSINNKYPSKDKKVTKKQNTNYEEQIDNLETRLDAKQEQIKNIEN